MPTTPILLLLVISVPFVSHAAPTPESLTEIETLTAFKLNLFDTLEALNAWDPSTSFAPCNWRGNLLPKIVNLIEFQILNVTGNNLSGKVPGELPKSIWYVDFSSNSFFGEIPKNISILFRLQLINLSYNRFFGGILAALGELQMLQFIWLDYNLLEGTLPSTIANCSLIVHFFAEGNALGISYFLVRFSVRLGNCGSLRNYRWQDCLSMCILLAR
ncbi:hypothetical protein LguiB_015105 [Lonicera macranthoides]